jgi:hypothetical protein
MNPNITISKLFKSLGNLTSIIVSFFAGINRALDNNASSMLNFANNGQLNLVHTSNISYICQEFENLAFIGVCQQNVIKRGYHLTHVNKQAAQRAAFLHLHNSLTSI